MIDYDWFRWFLELWDKSWIRSANKQENQSTTFKERVLVGYHTIHKVENNDLQALTKSHDKLTKWTFKSSEAKQSACVWKILTIISSLHCAKHSHVSIVYHFVMDVMCTCDMTVFVGFLFIYEHSNG